MKIECAFLDSGTGGIPYMLYLKKHHPKITCTYLADCKNFPYGEKTQEQIVECSSSAIKTIIQKWNVSTVIIACNTISVSALSKLRSIFPDISIVGTVPAIKLASELSKNKRIGLLATKATVESEYCKNLQKEFAQDCHLFSRADATLVSFIEKNLFTASEEEKLEAVRPAVNYFIENDCDTVILGCTHFIHFATLIEKLANGKFITVDSRDGVINQALKVIEDNRQSKNRSDVKIKNENIFTLALDFLDNTKDCSLYVSATDKNLEHYKNICTHFSIPWAGVI